MPSHHSKHRASTTTSTTTTKTTHKAHPQAQQQEQSHPTIAALCQQCNLLFCEILHHVSIIAATSNSHPSANHRGYSHDQLVGAYASFRAVCQGLRVYGRGEWNGKSKGMMMGKGKKEEDAVKEETVEKKIERCYHLDGLSGFVLWRFKDCLRGVIRGLEEVKPVITKQAQRKVLVENLMNHHNHNHNDNETKGKMDINTLQTKMAEDPDLAWFEKFLTESSLRCIVKGTGFLEEMAGDVMRRVKKGVELS